MERRRRRGAEAPHPARDAAVGHVLGRVVAFDRDDGDMRLEPVVLGGEIREERGERPPRQVRPVALQRVWPRGLPVPRQVGREHRVDTIARVAAEDVRAVGDRTVFAQVTYERRAPGVSSAKPAQKPVHSGVPYATIRAMRTQSTVCFGFAALVVLPLVTSLSAAGPERAPAKAAVPTFAKDVAPILYKNCTTCHRPGEIAPMSLLTYDDVRPYVKEIRDEVGVGHMPTWHAAVTTGSFEKVRRLSDEDRKTLLAWVAGGSPKGSAKDLPAMPQYPEGWTIGKPDAVFEMAET